MEEKPISSLEGKTLGERVSIIETIVVAGSPALRALEVRVTSVEHSVENNKEELVQHAEKMTLVREEVNVVSKGQAQMVRILKNIQITLIAFCVGYTANIVLEEAGSGGLHNIFVALGKVVL
tara:strand:- start:461 stop:826 length:366 start_codon:yes stop_codon:yes gene_type:complete